MGLYRRQIRRDYDSVICRAEHNIATALQSDVICRGDGQCRRSRGRRRIACRASGARATRSRACRASSAARTGARTAIRATIRATGCARCSRAVGQADDLYFLTIYGHREACIQFVEDVFYFTFASGAARIVGTGIPGRVRKARNRAGAGA